MDDFQVYREILNLKDKHISAAIAIVVDSSGSSPRKAGAKMIVRGDGTLLGSVGGGKIESDTIFEAHKVIEKGSSSSLIFNLTEEHDFVCGGRVQVYIEPILAAPHLLAIGAGHIGQALKCCARKAGFNVTLVDPYPENTMFVNDGFDNPDHVCNPEEIFTQLTVNDKTYIVIATRSHKDDFVVTENALKTNACYIGLLGSNRKKKALAKFLKQKNVPQKNVTRVVTPVGLCIGSQTPEEIAVSITAQLIQTRRAHEKKEKDHCYTCGSRKVSEDGEF